MPDLEHLNHHFAIPGHIDFVGGPGGLIHARINNTLASAEIALQGAHIFNWHPHGEAPVLWLSEAARFEPGEAIRGGVPICWPWFGLHEQDAALPPHGFARTVMWKVATTEALPDGGTRIVFMLTQEQTPPGFWPHAFTLSYSVTVGSELAMELGTHNTGDTPFAISEGLHTYFTIGDIAEMEIRGLKGCTYVDKADELKRKVEADPLIITAEVDRVYLDTTSACRIEDRKLNRRIRIAKHGSQSTVVWNPWSEKAEIMGDMGVNGYRSMVCVETVNALDNALTVAPGETHMLRAIYSVEP